MSENTVVVLGADERALRRLAELLAPYMPAAEPSLQRSSIGDEHA